MADIQKELTASVLIQPRYGTTASVNFGYYAGTLLSSPSLRGRTLWDICFRVEGQYALVARMCLVDDRAKNTNIWDSQLKAYTKQFVKLYDAAWEMGLLGKIEYSSNTDLDNIWGKVYEQPRLASESDDDYKKRLQVYIKQLTGCGTKANCEQIISTLVERPNACRIDTYWPAFARIYITDALASSRARTRATLISYIIPKMLASGVDWQFYNNFYELDAYIALLGEAQTSLPAYLAIQQDGIETGLLADCRIALEIATELEAAMCLKGYHLTELQAHGAIQEDMQYSLPAYLRLKKSISTTLEARSYFAKLIPANLQACIALATPMTRTLTANMRLVEA
jgi:hypothetical protein